jgi:hypothetical protein
MIFFRPLALAAALLALLAGCSTAPAPATADEYLPPAAGVPSATLKGVRLSEGGLFGETHTAYVYMVDLTSLRDAANAWDKSIAIAAGKRTVMAEYRFSNFKARATLLLNAAAGHSYQLMIAHGRDNTPELKLFCEFWIVDHATGKPVTPVYRAQVMGGKKGTIFNVPT